MPRLPRVLFLVTLLVAACLAPALRAEITCPAVLGSHMVLQRGRPVPLWGKALPGERIVVDFAGLQRETTADEAGAWSLELPALEASAQGRPLRISGSTTLQFEDVLVGEVWLCSGQSNMEKNIGPRAKQQPTDDWERDLESAELPMLRLFLVPRHGKPKPAAPSLRWLPCTGENLAASGFSAAAYHFGRELQARLGVPVGLLCSSFGGTRIEPWTPREAFAKLPSLAPFAAAQPGEKVDGIVPSSLYETMIAPLAPYGLRGFLWYQGESNCMNGDTLAYVDKMRALVEGWRTAFKAGNAPFNYVLIAPWHYSKHTKDGRALTVFALPLFQEAQAAALSIANTALVPVGDRSPDFNDIHPTDKRSVGLRLARLALARTYGVQDGAGPVMAPAPLRWEAADGKLRIWLSNTEGGLRTSDGAAPAHFLIAGEDRVFRGARCAIESGSIVLSHPSVPRPVAARHAFHEAAYPNLTGASGLPLLPFRTDDWPLEVHSQPYQAGHPTSQKSPVPSAQRLRELTTPPPLKLE